MNKELVKQFLFELTINDTFSTYSYLLNLPDDVSIYDIVKTVCEKYDIEIPEGQLVN